MGNKGTFEPGLNRRFSENPPKAPAPEIKRLIHDIGSSVFDVIPIGGATWLSGLAEDYKGEMIVPYDYNDTFLQMVGFVKAIKAGKPCPNLLRECYHSTVAVLPGLQAMDKNRVVSRSKKYIMPKEF